MTNLMAHVQTLHSIVGRKRVEKQRQLRHLIELSGIFHMVHHRGKNSTVEQIVKLIDESRVYQAYHQDHNKAPTNIIHHNTLPKGTVDMAMHICMAYLIEQRYIRKYAKSVRITRHGYIYWYNILVRLAEL